MDNVENLEWMKSTESLEDILQNPRVKLPQLIRLSTQLDFQGTKTTLQPTQILTILARRSISYINAVDSHGKDVSLPLCCPYSVKLVAPPDKVCTFETVEDVIKCDPLPRFVEVTNVEKTDEKIVVGDVFKIMFVEKSDYAFDYIHFRNSSGTLVKVCANDQISFQLATGYATSVPLSSLFDRRQKTYPVHIQFMKQDKIPKTYLEFGMLTLPSSEV